MTGEPDMFNELAAIEADITRGNNSEVGRWLTAGIAGAGLVAAIDDTGYAIAALFLIGLINLGSVAQDRWRRHEIVRRWRGRS